MAYDKQQIEAVNKEGEQKVQQQQEAINDYINSQPILPKSFGDNKKFEPVIGKTQVGDKEISFVAPKEYKETGVLEYSTGLLKGANNADIYEESVSKGNKPVMLMSRNDFLDNYKDTFENPNDVYDNIKASYEAYQLGVGTQGDLTYPTLPDYDMFKEYKAIKRSVDNTVTPLISNRFLFTEGGSMIPLYTEDVEASLRNIVVLKAGGAVPLVLKDTKVTNPIKRSIDPVTGSAYWKESKDGELIAEGAIMGSSDRLLKSSTANSIIKGATYGVAQMVAGAETFGFAVEAIIEMGIRKISNPDFDIRD